MVLRTGLLFFIW